ncbi:phosphoenolpyruvate--protein phosphotransferase [bacterium]|nr:MAG: phosphoenolpyruvate--protein phosphotransferase [bacterium]
MRHIQGISASPGYAVGPVHRVRRPALVAPRRAIKSTEIDAEVERFRAAVGTARDQIQQLVTSLARELGAGDADILSAQLLILEDELVWDATLAVIRMDRVNAEAAFSRAVSDIAARFLEIEDETFRERVGDLRDVEQRVLRAFAGVGEQRIDLPSVPSIVVANDLAPSDTAALGRENVLGFAMNAGGATSHVAILARSLGVPAVLGLAGGARSLTAGQEVALDGVAGVLIADPDEETREHFGSLTRHEVVINEKLVGLRDLAAETPDGRQVNMLANIELPMEVEEALARGAEGIGLLRTEYLFFQHQSIPNEQEQVQVYAEIVRRMEGRPVIFRVLDVGGDKVSDYLGAKREYNPFLGWRGIRFLLANRPLFKTQVKAIYRAAVAGRVRIMIPMITGVGELREARAVCAEAAAELARDGVEHDPDLELGIINETPSAVLAADLLAREADFFSIGTNDLIQYMLAMDRGNARVAYLYQPLHPAVLRAIDQTVKAGHEAGIEVGLCGEMGSETRLAEVLLGLGLDSISLHGAALPKVKQVIRWTAVPEARALVERLMALPTAADADRHLADYIAERKRRRSEKEQV